MNGTNGPRREGEGKGNERVPKSELSNGCREETTHDKPVRGHDIRRQKRREQLVREAQRKGRDKKYQYFQRILNGDPIQHQLQGPGQEDQKDNHPDGKSGGGGDWDQFAQNPFTLKRLVDGKRIVTKKWEGRGGDNLTKDADF